MLGCIKVFMNQRNDFPEIPELVQILIGVVIFVLAIYIFLPSESIVNQDYPGECSTDCYRQ